MKRIAWLFLVVLCSAVLLNAEDKAHAMNGWICDSKCVVQEAGRNTCDRTCTERSGDAVFISDQGEVMAVANQDICASHMNKRVKIRASHMTPVQTTEQGRENQIRIMEIQDESGAG
ncbi:MAG: hypothetical protein ABSD96_08060 [Candidatus Korobacteraceae bacterium]|jgi:hypothetical protein